MITKWFFQAMLSKRFSKTFVWGLSSTFTKQWKSKLFVAREIQYFKLGISSFNSYVYYLTHGFIASIRTFNLPTRAFNLPTRAFSLSTCAFNLPTRAFSVLTCVFERWFELVTRRFELLTRGFELVTRNSCFTFPQKNRIYFMT